MDARSVIYIVLASLYANTIAIIMSPQLLPFLALSLAAIAFLHELLHLVALRALRTRFKFVSKGVLVGFKATFRNRKELVVALMAPQAISLVLALLIPILSWQALALLVGHILISLEDLAKGFRYAFLSM